VVQEVTDIEASFYKGTLFLSTTDSKIATDVFNAIYDKITKGLVFGKTGDNETFYDFI
jgi:hypothetical protein